MRENFCTTKKADPFYVAAAVKDSSLVATHQLKHNFVHIVAATTPLPKEAHLSGQDARHIK